MNDIQKFKDSLATIMDNTFLRGIFTADSEVGGFADIMNRVQGAMNDNPDGTVEQIVASAEVAVRASLGMPNE